MTPQPWQYHTSYNSSPAKEGVSGTSLVVQQLRLHASKARGPGLIPDQGTRSHVLHLSVHMLQLNILHTATKIRDPTLLRPKRKEERRRKGGRREKRRALGTWSHRNFLPYLSLCPSLSSSSTFWVGAPLRPSAAKRRRKNEYGVLDFPGGSVVKNPSASAGNVSSVPGPGRSQMPRSD